VSVTAYAPCAECPDEATCGIRLVMKEARDAIAQILDGTSLAEMVRRSHEQRHARPDSLHYDI
jgi:DNA-binding IscR family transcriptional regulator